MTDLDTLIKGLSSRNPKVRKESAEALGRAADEGTDITSAIPALVFRLSDPHESVRRTAATALGNAAFEGLDITSAISTLINALSDGNGKIQAHAAWALEATTLRGGQIDLEKVAEALKKYVDKVRESHDEALIRKTKRECTGFYLSIANGVSESKQKMDMGGELLTERPKPPKGHPEGMYQKGRAVA